MSTNKPGCLAAIFGVRSRPQIAKPRVAVKTAATNRVPITVVTNQVSADQTFANQTPDLFSDGTPTTKEELQPSEKFPYSSRGILLTNAEASFFHFLRGMTKDFLVIFPHIALRDLITVIDQSEYYTHYNKIDRKQVDFVLCDPKTLKPVFVIELDDSSHNRPDRKERDAFVENILESVKIPLVRVAVRHSYDSKELGLLFKGAVEKYVEHKKEPPNHQFTIDNPPFCSKHGIRMILRTARQRGEKFWGCPNYPHCREIIKLKISPN